MTKENFREIYDKYKKKVYSKALILLKNQSQAEDVTQEVFIKVFYKFNSLKNPEKFEAWLNTIIFNSSMRYIKENSKKWIIYDEKLITCVPEDDLTEIKYLRKESCKDVSDAINELPEHYRIPIVLYYYYNIKIKNISKKMGCSIGTIKSRLFSAKSILREKLSQKL